MTLNGAQIIVENELNKIAGSEWQLHVMQSHSTNSRYYKLINSKTSLIFRISDHITYKDMSTLVISKHVTEMAIRNYVRNRVKDFRKRTLNVILGIKKGK